MQTPIPQLKKVQNSNELYNSYLQNNKEIKSLQKRTKSQIHLKPLVNHNGASTKSFVETTSRGSLKKINLSQKSYIKFEKELEALKEVDKKEKKPMIL